MKNQTLIGIVAGAAALGIAGVIFARQKKKSRSNTIATLANEYKGKLNNLQRKAEKEFKRMDTEGDNPAAERVNQWVNGPSN